MITDTA